MDQFSDDFISYENFADIKFDTILEPNFTFTSPFSNDDDSYFPDLFPNKIQNLLDSPELPRNDSTELSSAPSLKKSKPFQIIKCKKNEPVERLDYSDPPSVFSPMSVEPLQENKLMNKSKRIAKVEKAKERVLAKQNHEEFINSVDVRYIPEGYGDPALDTKTQKKMLKVIKNRISAQNSRDRKKNYIEQLEEIRDNYAEENKTLKQEKDILLERMEKMQADYELVLKENELLKAGSSVNMKYQCGYTADFETTDTATEVSEKISSPGPQPVNTENSGHYSIFSVALAALLCLLFIMTGGQLGEFPTKVMENIKSPTIIRLSKSLLGELNVNSFTEDVELSLKELNFADLPILNKIKPLMEEFEKFHGTVSQSTDNVQRYATDLFQSESLENSVATEEKVATLFAPAAFELSKSTPNMEVEANFDSSEKVGLENAEYLQLLVPKYSIGKLGVRSDVNEMRSILDCGRFGEDNSLVEVWCKVLARRNTAISL